MFTRNIEIFLFKKIWLVYGKLITVIMEILNLKRIDYFNNIFRELSILFESINAVVSETCCILFYFKYKF